MISIITAAFCIPLFIYVPPPPHRITSFCSQVLKASVRTGIRLQSSSAAAASASASHSGHSALSGYSFGGCDVAPLNDLIHSIYIFSSLP